MQLEKGVGVTRTVTFSLASIMKNKAQLDQPGLVCMYKSYEPLDEVLMTLDSLGLGHSDLYMS